MLKSLPYAVRMGIMLALMFLLFFGLASWAFNTAVGVIMGIAGAAFIGTAIKVGERRAAAPEDSSMNAPDDTPKLSPRTRLLRSIAFGALIVVAGSAMATWDGLTRTDGISLAVVGHLNVAAAYAWQGMRTNPRYARPKRP